MKSDVGLTTAVDAHSKTGARMQRRHRLNRRALTGYAFVSPALFLLLVFSLLPFLFALWVSLHEWNMLTPVRTMPFTGLANYRYLLTQDPLFGQAFKNTVEFAIANVAISCVLALCVALLLNTNLRFRALWRIIFFLPYVTSSVAISIVWSNLYQPSYGMFNGILDLFHLPELRFLSSPSQALPSVIAVAVWAGIGYYMIIFLAGLQAIPADLYDAAKVDGATSWQRFWSVTLPLLRPTVLFVVVVNTIASLQIFDLVFILTSGGPVNSTNTIVLYMYNTAFQFLKMGRATAMSVMLFLVIFVITLIQLRLLRERS